MQDQEWCETVARCGIIYVKTAGVVESNQDPYRVPRPNTETMERLILTIPHSSGEGRGSKGTRAKIRCHLVEDGGRNDLTVDGADTKAC